ncbi:unnamed protein product [Sphagnum balticum]
MKSDSPIDFAIFQLTPTRTRCELLVVCGTEAEKLSAGLLQPYLEHLKTAEEQVKKGGYSIKLEPPPEYPNGSNKDAPWFTKGTMERFVRFVSTPELLERISTVEWELSQIEEAISLQTSDPSSNLVNILRFLTLAHLFTGTRTSLPLVLDKPGISPPLKVDPYALISGCHRRRLLRAMDSRRLALQKEQGMTFARAGAAGFDMEHLTHLTVFADCFGATRLGDACAKFIALCNKRKESILWMEEMELAAAAAEAAALTSTPPRLISKDQYVDMWTDAQGGEADILRVEVGDDVSHSYPPNQGVGYVDGNRSQGQWLQRQASDHHWQSSPGYYNDGPGYVQSGEPTMHPNLEGGYGNMIPQGEKDLNVVAAIGTAGHTPPTSSAMEGMVSDNKSLSDTEADGPSPSHKHSRRSARHSTSPNRRSSSPLRKVQVGRSGSRRSGVVVIRNINYITNPSVSVEKSTGKDYSEASESLDETDSAMGDEDDEKKLSGPGSLSVKDAISLFEVKRRESRDSPKKRLSKQGSRRGSIGNAEKPVLRRWSSTAGEQISEPSMTSEKSDGLDGSDDSLQNVATTERSEHSETTDLLQDKEQPGPPFHHGSTEKMLSVPTRSVQVSRSGLNFEAEAGMPVQNLTNTESSESLEDTFILPHRDTHSLVRTSLYSEPESSVVQPSGTQLDDSFMIPKRSGQASETKLREVNQDHEMVLVQKPELTDESFIVPDRAQAHEQSELGWRSELHLDAEMPSNKKNKVQTEETTTAPEELFMFPDRQGGRESLGWSTAVDHSMECLAPETIDQKSAAAANADNNVDPAKESKVKGQPSTKKVEKRKSEVVARHARLSEKHAPSADAQLRAEKLRAFKADLARSKKEKDEEERKRLEALRALRRERIAARSNPATAAATPHASQRQLSSPKPSPLPKLSPQKSTSRPIRGSMSTLAPPTISKSSRIFQRRASTALKSSSNPLSQSVPSFAELRKENTKPSAVRSSSIFERGSLKKNQSLPARHASTAPLEANRTQPSSRLISSMSANNDDKKRLRSSAIRRSVSELSTEPQEVQVSAPRRTTKVVEVEQKEQSTKTTNHLSTIPKTLKPYSNGYTLAPELVVAEDEFSSSFTPTAAEESPAHSETHISASTNSSPVAYIVPRAMMSSSPISTPTRATSAPAEVYDAPLATVTDYTSPKYDAPKAIVSSSSLDALPVLQASLSPEEVGNTNSSGRSRKTWGSSQKLALTGDNDNKESPKGLRKLLKFGRKSRNSNANDSATSEGDEDTEATSEAGFSEVVVKIEKGRQNGSHSKNSKRASVISNVRLSVRSSLPTPPSDSKMLDGKSSGGSSGKASRSFFAAFRSKTNEAKA